jgi:CheY-like chemotaxis protein
MLGGLGYKNVSVVENGELAVNAALAKRFQVVLMDCMMPVVSGFEATRMIRQRVPKADQPKIIALTADAFKENAQRCMDSGMDFVLYKP